jgi:hypothetical protein
MAQKILAINKTHTTKNHPYKITSKTEAMFSIKFKTGKGFKSIFQTRNMATAAWNTPQISTYTDFIYTYLNEDRHIAFGYYQLKNYEDVNTLAQFIAAHFDALQLTEPMIKELYDTLHRFITASVTSWKPASMTEVPGWLLDKFVGIITPTLETITKGKQTGENIFSEINLDVAAIRQLEKEYESQAV